MLNPNFSGTILKQNRTLAILLIITLSVIFTGSSLASEDVSSTGSATLATQPVSDSANHTSPVTEENIHETAAGHGDFHHGGFHAEASKLARELPLWTGIPFAGILLSIALFPILAPHFWHHHYPKVAFAWALIFAVPFLIAYKGLALYSILHIYLVDYIPFIILLWGLYTVSGGLIARGMLVGTPGFNTRMLVLGTILASMMGTTGASMLLIRPMLRANEFRKSKMHIVIFFIFLVSNVGGSLTPLGDPPLFLGFLHGVPFFWTFGLFPEFLVVSVILLLLFYLIDSRMYKKEGGTPPEKAIEVTGKYPLRFEGIINLFWLAGIIILVLISGTVKLGHITIYEIQIPFQNIIRDLGIVTMGILSLKSTHKTIRTDNNFTWHPIQEVAYLFAGIFMCIIPMLAILSAGSDGSMSIVVNAVKEPPHYFWITGALSSFLDNAPTYLTFFQLALGKLHLTEPQMTQILTGAMQHPHAAQFITDLKAISIGAVFFGAMTYIGNAPNFMVRSIAEESGIKMPSFFGYMVWSGLILIPTFILVTIIFFY